MWMMQMQKWGRVKSGHFAGRFREYKNRKREGIWGEEWDFGRLPNHIGNDILGNYDEIEQGVNTGGGDNCAKRKRKLNGTNQGKPLCGCHYKSESRLRQMGLGISEQIAEPDIPGMRKEFLGGGGLIISMSILHGMWKLIRYRNMVLL